VTVNVTRLYLNELERQRANAVYAQRDLKIRHDVSEDDGVQAASGI
jgi:hypothetical protein